MDLIKEEQNCATLEEIKTNANGKTLCFCVPGSEDLMLSIWQYSPTDLQIPPSLKIQSFAKTDKLILIFMQNCQRPQITKTILKKNAKVGGLTPSDFKTCYRATDIKAVQHQCRVGQKDQWNRRGHP